MRQIPSTIHYAYLVAIAVILELLLSPFAFADLVLFDANTHPASKLKQTTQPWTKGSDIVPIAVTVEKDGGKMLAISYSGKQGSGTTWVVLNADETNEVQRMHPSGVQFRIDYDMDDFNKLLVICFFSDGSTLTSKLTLEKGLHVHAVQTGYRKATTPLRWETLTKIYIESSQPDLQWRLKDISVMETNKKGGVPLALDRTRKVHEVLPAAAKVDVDGKLDEWTRVQPLESYYYHASGADVALADSPIKVKLCYDDEYLYVASASVFPTAPLAVKTKQDDTVWDDESLQLFFSSELDNNSFIQFVVNQRGTVFDFIREFDVAAQFIVTKKEWNMKHEKAFTYDAGLWKTEMAFPLSELKYDRRTNNLLAFQIAQVYAPRAEDNLKTVVWSSAKYLPTPNSFGILVFNRNPFGNGELSIAGIEKNTADGVDVSITCALSNFIAGEYTILVNILSPDTAATISERISIPGSALLHDITVKGGIKNKNSSYTCYVSICNSNGDARVAAVNFNNAVEAVDLFGKKLFFPEPKIIQWNAGEFKAGTASALFLDADATPRTLRTAEIFTNRFYGYTGRLLTIKKGAPADEGGGILFKIAKTASYAGKDVSLKKEGYLLSVKKDRITCIGGDEPGLYYAGVTFFQLLRNTMKIRDRHPVACVDILDWPDIQYRNILFNGQWQFGGGEIKEHATGDNLIAWTDRFVAGTKMNLLFIDIWAEMQFKRRPEFNKTPKKSFTLGDAARLADFCRDNFIEAVPFFQTGGHADGWLLQAHPELREKGFSVQADVSNPDHDAIVYDCFQDAIDAMKPKYFSPKGDEWWQQGKTGEAADELLGGKPRNRVFLDWHVKLNTWLNEKGIRMLLYHDMLTPFHNGKTFDIYKIIDEFPKNIIIMPWADRSYTRPEYFYERGFTLWINATAGALFDTERTKVPGYGLGMYDGWFGTRSIMARSFAKTRRTPTYPRIIRLSDWAWNYTTGKADSVDDWISMGKIAAGIQSFAVTPNPVAGEMIECMDIASYANASINDYASDNKIVSTKGALVLANGILDCGFIPMKFSGGNSKDCISIRHGGDAVSIAVKKKYASLIFLHTLHYTDEMVKKLPGQMYRQWQRGFPAGMYVVHYADGSSVTIPLRIDRNIGLNDDVANAMNPSDCRYLLAIKTGSTPFNLHQYEWVNPKPDTVITSISMMHDNYYDFTVFLFALSGRLYQRQ